jgi:hypothetical protein
MALEMDDKGLKIKSAQRAALFLVQKRQKDT